MSSPYNIIERIEAVRERNRKEYETLADLTAPDPGLVTARTPSVQSVPQNPLTAPRIFELLTAWHQYLITDTELLDELRLALIRADRGWNLP